MFLFNVTNAQSTFEYIDQTDNTFLITSPREHSNGDIYFTYIHLEDSEFYGGVRSINGGGTLTRDLEMKVDNKNNEVLQIELFEEEERLLVLSSQYSYMDSESYINIKSLDLDLSILSDTTITLDTIDFIIQISTAINSEGNVISTFTNGFFPGIPVLNYLLEVTPEGIVKQFNRIPEEFSVDPYWSICNTENGYVCVGRTTIAINDSLNQFEIIETDKVYELGNNVDAINWGSNEYLVTNFEGGTDLDYSLSKLDSTMQIIQTVEYNDAINSANNLSAFGSLDFEYTDLIYTGGHEVLFQSYFWLAQHDSNLDRNWIKFYDTEEDGSYVAFGIEASKDGGVMICGQKYNSAPNGGFLFKFDSNGDLLTSTTENATNISTITVYPNPSDGLFRIKIDANSNRDYTLILTDSNGKTVHTSTRLNNGDHSFDFTHLSTSKYFYTLTSDGEIKGQGSWIKI